MRSKAILPSYEFILQHFQTQRGLYILGAGASAGSAPFGGEFSRVPSLDYLRNFGSFPAIIPAHDERELLVLLLFPDECLLKFLLAGKPGPDCHQNRKVAAK